jgi:predicted enzyme related to lactoylglutathione lyase
MKSVRSIKIIIGRRNMDGKAPAITNRIGMVFVPVSDIEKAIHWYNSLFDVPLQQVSHQGTIYNFPMQGDVGLILDGTRTAVKNSSQPLCFFWTDDIQVAYQFLEKNDVDIVREIEDIGSLYTLTFKDPDGNLLMVCQRNA